MSVRNKTTASALLAMVCISRLRPAFVWLIAGILAIQGAGLGLAKALPASGGNPQESESEPGRTDQSSEEGCQEEVGLTTSPRFRRAHALLTERATRLTALKSQLVVVRHFAFAPPAAEHACRNGLGAPLRC